MYLLEKLDYLQKLAEHEMQRLDSGEIDIEQYHERLVSTWDSVDNRMGQLVYDNIFWNKVVKDTAMLAVRSVGWNLGSWREYAGAGTDLVTSFERMKRGDKFLSQKMAYSISAIVLYAVLGAVIMKILTGENPKELKDYYFPKTGNKNPDGSDERLSLPTYAKDWFAYGTQPLKTITHKIHPLWGIIGDIVTNKDFFGVEVRKEDDPLLRQIQDVLVHIVKESRSISIKNYEKMSKVSDDKFKNIAVSITGISSAPGYITKSPAQKLMNRYIAERIPKGSKTTEEFERSSYRRTLINRLRKGEQVERREAVDILGYKGYYAAKKAAKKTPFEGSFNRLSIKEAINVFIIANKEEREESRDLLKRKYYKYKSDLTKEEQREVKDLIYNKGRR